VLDTGTGIVMSIVLIDDFVYMYDEITINESV